MAENFLDKVYKTTGDGATRDLYDAWSGSYDAAMAENGYLTPRRLAEALRNVWADISAPILDYGCGTGLSGAALHAAGFETFDGADPSAGMLEQAGARAIYRRLITLDLSKPLPFGTGEYRAILASGVISTGAGPASLMDTLMELLPSGGYLAFSLNDHALGDPDYPAGVERLRAAGHIEHVADYGVHLPKRGLKSMIYVFEKT